MFEAPNWRPYAVAHLVHPIGPALPQYTLHSLIFLYKKLDEKRVIENLQFCTLDQTNYVFILSFIGRLQYYFLQ
jgi:hypothetical protein